MAEVNIPTGAKHEETILVTSDVAIDFLLNKTPILVNVTNGPSKNIQEIHRDGGLFAQDQWKLDRFTINLGIRWDWFNAGIPQQTNPASNFTPALTMPGDYNTRIDHIRQAQWNALEMAFLSPTDRVALEKSKLPTKA